MREVIFSLNISATEARLNAPAMRIIVIDPDRVNSCSNTGFGVGRRSEIDNNSSIRTFSNPDIRAGTALYISSSDRSNTMTEIVSDPRIIPSKTASRFMLTSRFDSRILNISISSQLLLSVTRLTLDVNCKCMTWYTASFSDKGAGMNGQTFYVEGNSESEAEEIARANCNNDMDPDSVEMRELGDLDMDELYKKLFMAGGYNVAYTKDGEKIRRSDVDSDDF